jgi:hypothetical protein
MQSSFDPAKDLQPLLQSKLTLSPDLPVNVFTRYLEAEAPGQPEEKIRAVANLYQTVLELERDGDLLQDLYRFYIALKLPVYVGQLASRSKFSGNAQNVPIHALIFLRARDLLSILSRAAVGSIRSPRSRDASRWPSSWLNAAI